MSGGKETVLNGDSAVIIAYVTTIVAAVLSIKAAIELTVAEHDIGTSIDNGYETAVSGIAIHTAVERHRHATVLNRYCCVGADIANKTGCMLYATAYGTSHMQILDSGIGHKVEGSSIVLRGRLVDGYRMAVAVKRAPIGLVALPTDSFLIKYEK